MFMMFTDNLIIVYLAEQVMIIFITVQYLILSFKKAKNYYTNVSVKNMGIITIKPETLPDINTTVFC